MDCCRQAREENGGGSLGKLVSRSQNLSSIAQHQVYANKVVMAGRYQFHHRQQQPGARGHSVSPLALTVVVTLIKYSTGGEASVNASLELQGGHCSAQLTLICSHSETRMAPLWIHNATVERGETLGTAFPDAMYTVQTPTEHTATITGVDSVRALDGCIFQCAYEYLGNLSKSNAVTFSFIPPDHRPALSLVSFTHNFSERLFTFTYSYQESCILYPRCTPYFSVEHTVSPQLAVSNSSSGCSVRYTILNLMRCVSYQSTATALLGSQRGNSVVVGSTVMQRPGRFTITDVSIGADRNLINVTYMENESDCPGYPTERYTVDVEGVQVADLTADAVQSLAINHANGSVTLSLPLNQPLPDNAVTLNMTKYNTVPTNKSDVTGNIVTEMVTWGTSAVFALQESPPSGEPPAAVNYGEVVIGVSVPVGILVLLAGGGGGTAVIVGVIKWRRKKKNERELQEVALGHNEPPMDDHEVEMRPEEEQEGNVRKPEQEGNVRKPEQEERKEGSRAPQRQHYAELHFADQRPIPAPPSDMFAVAYAEVGQA